jgi:exopolysaccharide biosynthesis polyprenyl glycosylphosphotransferase
MLSQILGSEELPAAADARRVDAVLEAGQISEWRGMVASQRRDALFRRSLAVADCAALWLALTTVVAIFPSLELRPAALATLPPAVLAAKLLGLYDRDETLLRKTTLEEMPKLFHLATLCSLLIWLGHGLVIAGSYDPANAFVLWVVLTLALPITRVAARALCLRLASTERCLVIGDPVTLVALTKRLAGRSGTNAEIVGHLDLDDDSMEREDDSTARGDEFAERLVRIYRRVTELDAHRVIVAPRSADNERVLDLVRTLRAIGTRVSFVPRVLEVLGTSVEFDDVHGITVMGVKRFHLSRSSALLKRSFDLVVASLLLIVLSPLMALFAVAIKLESQGRILFRQVRVGRGGAPFEMLKFRTMISNAESLKPDLLELNEAEAGFFKMASDPRVTRIGRLLRRSSLDELPQLINVIRSEMSLVGPRPLVCEEDEQVLGWSRRRLDLTPGMTGHWQILGSSRVPLPEMVAIDCVYVTTWSLWTDVKILLRTVPHVLGLRGK